MSTDLSGLLSAILATLALMTAAADYPLLTFVLAIVALLAAIHALMRVNDLAKIVKSDAEIQRREIRELGHKDES